MTNTDRPVYNTSNQLNESSGGMAFNLDIKKLIADLLRFWWLFVITIPLCMSTVFIIHRYSTPVYRASMRLLMEESGKTLPQENMMEGFGLTPGLRSVDNQLAILNSWNMASRAVSKLDFNISYFVKGRFLQTEVYGQSPFVVSIDSLHPQLLNTAFNIEVLDDEQYRLTFSTEGAGAYVYGTRKGKGGCGPLEYTQVHRFGELVTSQYYSFIMNKRAGDLSRMQHYYFKFNHPDAVTSLYNDRFKAYKINDNSNIVLLTVTGENRSKNIRFLNKIAKEFIASNLEKKNQIAINTIAFIEEQLVTIADSLNQTGSELSQFRTDNRVQDISLKAENLFAEMKELEVNMASKSILKNYYLYLQDYFSGDSLKGEVVAPAILDVENSFMSEQIRKIMEMNSERISLRRSYGEALNPGNRKLENKIEIAKNTLLRSIKSQLNVVDESLSRLKGQKVAIEQELNHMPETERRMLNIQQKYQLSNEVYTFLLRKRSESQIQKASNTPDHQVLEAAKTSGLVSPNHAGNQQKALLIGFILPMAFIVLRQLLNNKVQTQDDVEKITGLPVLGHIIHNKKEGANVIYDHPRSVITETFRRIRGRLEFLNGHVGAPVIAVSSSMPGEGKTFCALNLAAVFALSGKKTVLLGFDLRKPGLNKVMGIKNDKVGITNFLIGKASVDEILIPSGQDNLTLIGSGVIPPNPSELIGTSYTDELLAQLREKFDVIILDTPPMGVVTDPFLLARKADSVVYLVRQNYTIQEVFAKAIRNLSEEGIDHVGIMINDVMIDKHGYGGKYSYGYGYNYGYGYGYEKGYYEE
ncbi:polysaccharide biosynthesis tyrosine autokinase [Marinilabiliaceae bacterium JC017]|nr:polysaccharide biosynthesis tyrosine autokinase [Marinilabiliaceae bacterium JC017]